MGAFWDLFSLIIVQRFHLTGPMNKSSTHKHPYFGFLNFIERRKKKNNPTTKSKLVVINSNRLMRSPCWALIDL